MARIQSAAPPKLLSRRQVMARQIVSSRDDQLLASVNFRQYRRRVGVRRLSGRVGRPLDFPQRLARRTLGGQDVGRIVGVHAVQHLNKELSVVQQGRGGIAPVQPELSIVLLQIPLPDLFPAEIEAG